MDYSIDQIIEIIKKQNTNKEELSDEEIEKLAKEIKPLKQIDPKSPEIRDIAEAITSEKKQNSIKEILEDNQFAKECSQILNRTNLDADMRLYEKIARIDIKGVKFKEYEHPREITCKELMQYFAHFCMWLDERQPKGNSDFYFANQFFDNKKYITLATIKNKNQRSYVAWEITSDGETLRKIFINLKNHASVVGSIRNANHELVGHSFGQGFLKCKKYIDPRMEEFCGVVAEHLTHKFLLDKAIPFGLAEDCAKDRTEYLLRNVIKAREALAEACVIKIMTGTMSLEEAQEKYADIISSNMVDKIISDIKEHKFKGMKEGKYLLPQIVAYGFMKDFDDDPMRKVGQFVNILGNETTLDLDCIAYETAGKTIKELTEMFVTDLQGKADELKSSNRIGGKF